MLGPWRLVLNWDDEKLDHFFLFPILRFVSTSFLRKRY